MPTVSGKYEHRVDDIPNDITESWHVEQLTSEKNILRISFQANYILTAEVIFDANFRILQFDYHISDDLKGQYRIADGKLFVNRTLPGNTQLDDALVWSENAVLDLPFLSCKGHTILHLKEYGTAPTFAPIFRSGDRAGDLAKKTVRFVGDDVINIGSKTYPTTHYHYMRDYWLDENGRVLKVQDDSYEMILVEYTL